MRKLFYILAVAASCVLISCSKGKDNPTPVAQVVVEGEEDEVTESLKKAPGLVRIRKEVRSEDNGYLPGVPVYYAYFKQLVDHKDPSKGTFEHRVAITLPHPFKKGETDLNILHTQGYNTADKADGVYTTGFQLGQINEVEVEYRYFGTSLPEPFENLEFNYLSSEQQSWDLHTILSALKQTDLFPGQWISTGVSKNGITTALYAYYDELNGWNDIDVYVPFCAPFITSLDNPSVGNYIEQVALEDMPELRQRIFDIGRLVADDSEAGANFRNEIIADLIASGCDTSGMTEESIKEYMCGLIHAYNTNIFERLSYINIDDWRDFIPDLQNEYTSSEQLLFFLFASVGEFRQAIYEQQLAKSSGGFEMSEERRKALLECRQQSPSWPYQVQAVLELGTYIFPFNFLEGCSYITKQDMLQWQENNTSAAAYYPEYVSRYNGKMMADFLNNLNTTSKKMVFVYGGNDPWTGAAIPDSATNNPNVKKMIMPWGTHTDDLLSRDNWWNKGEEIVLAIDAFLDE